MKKLVWVLAILGAMLMVGLAWYAGFQYSSTKKRSYENSTVLLERVQKVCKLVAAEGHFSEIYNYKDYYYYDLPFLRKKALIRVNARVSMGYDFEKMEFQIDEQNRTISITNIPEPEILSIDHDLEYYDLDDGVFNSFSPEELTQLNDRAKAFIEDQAATSDLYEESIAQKDELLEGLEMMILASGWKLEAATALKQLEFKD